MLICLEKPDFSKFQQIMLPLQLGAKMHQSINFLINMFYVGFIELQPIVLVVISLRD